jgi:hypothetical protein
MLSFVATPLPLPLGLEGGCVMRILGSVHVFPRSWPLLRRIIIKQVGTGKQARSPLSPKVHVRGYRPHISTHNEARKGSGITHSRNPLRLQLEVSRLAVGTSLARHRQDDHTHVGVHPTRDVFKLHREQVNRHKPRVLTAAAVVTVGHGPVHIVISNDLSVLGVHLCVVPGRSLMLEEVIVAGLEGGGRLAATEGCDRDVGVVAKETCVA